MERVFVELARYFVNIRRCEVHIVLYGINRDIFYTVPDSISIHRPRFRFDNRFRFLLTIRTLIYVRSKVRELDPDFVLSFGEIWNSFVLLALYGLPFPVFVSDRSQPDKSLGPLHDWLRRKLYPRAAGVIAQTRAAKKIYHSFYNHQNIEVIGNPIRDIADRKVVRENIVLMVGRLIRSKHQDRLIELFSRINLPGWKLVIVGYDHLKQNNMVMLQRLVNDLGLHDRVILAGKQADVDDYYLRSKIFAFTSSSEGFPNAIGEAMAAGLPVVAFDCMAGPADMIEDGKDGFLVPLFDYTMFQEKLEVLMNNEFTCRRMGDHGRNSIRRFSIDHIGERYLSFILESSGGAKKRS